MSPFAITAAPNTDIWRKPPHTDIYNAPTGTPPSSLTTSGPLPSFRTARASFSFSWREQYDQAGLLLAFYPTSPPSASAAPSPPRWIKTGVEFYNGRPMLSTVSCDRWADWSVTPLPEPKNDSQETWTTISIEKLNIDGHGWSLWVFQVLEDETKVPLREICWVYGDEDLASWRLEVSAMAARPEGSVADGLEVKVRDMDVVWVA